MIKSNNNFFILLEFLISLQMYKKIKEKKFFFFEKIKKIKEKIQKSKEKKSHSVIEWLSVCYLNS